MSDEIEYSERVGLLNGIGLSDFGFLQFVTSGLSLTAFIVFLIFLYSLKRNDNLINVLKQAKGDKLPDIVDKFINRKNVDINLLSKNQRYEFAMKELQNAHSQSLMRLKMAICLFFLVFILAFMAIRSEDEVEKPLITGNVLDLNGTPIHNAIVTIQGHDFYVETDLMGTFSKQLGNAVTKGYSLNIMVSKPGYFPASRNVIINDKTISVNNIYLNGNSP